jgi:hypothetical protein
MTQEEIEKAQKEALERFKSMCNALDQNMKMVGVRASGTRPEVALYQLNIQIMFLMEQMSMITAMVMQLMPKPTEEKEGEEMKIVS